VSTETTPPHHIDASGDAYEPLTGRWSRLIAPDFVQWLDVAANARWLDVGCGTGALIQAILDTQRPAEIVGVDSSSSFIAYARRQITDDRVRYEVGDARDLPVPSSQFEGVVAGLVLNHIPQPELHRALAEMRRAARPGGVVAAYVWDYAEGMEPRVRFWEAAAAFDPAAAAHDERARYPICNPAVLQTNFQRVRLNAVETRAFAIDARFPSFDDYWTPFLAGYGIASRYLLSLPEDRRAALQAHLAHTLPTTPDGAIPLTIRAWGVMGVR
jgi:SAM-dependent methyltransferase